MGHKIGSAHKPRRGSLAFVPRVRAKRAYSTISNWPKSEDLKLLGFAAYKAGMTHIVMIDDSEKSVTKGEAISVPVTVLEAPKIKVIGIRLYGIDNFRQLKCISSSLITKLDKEFKKKLTLPKKKEEKNIDNLINDAVEVRALVATLPKGIAAGKKKPDIFEIAVGGKDIKAKYDYIKSILGKELSISDVFKPGDYVDVVSVSKGKGFQGPVKRFGVKLQSDKTDTTRRAVASIGPDVPRKTSWRVPMPGQLGYHNRTEFNKRILKIGNDGKEVTLSGGFLKYGVIKGDYLLIKGSVAGAATRLIRLRAPIRLNKKVPKEAPQIIRINK